MLTCPNCGSDNRYGAIFCRDCGKKLDIIDELTVENIDEKTKSRKRKRRKDKSARTPKQLWRKGIIVNAVRILVILLLAFAIYLTQQTPSVSAIPTSEGARGGFIKLKRGLRRGAEVTFTEKQINSYLAGVLPGVKRGKVVGFDNLQVALGNEKDKDEIAIRMYVRIFGKKMLFQMFGKLKSSNGKVKFAAATFAKIGKLPYPSFLMKLHCRNVLNDLQEDKELFGRLTKAAINDKYEVNRGGKTVTTVGMELKARKES